MSGDVGFWLPLVSGAMVGACAASLSFVGYGKRNQGENNAKQPKVIAVVDIQGCLFRGTEKAIAEHRKNLTGLDVSATDKDGTIHVVGTVRNISLIEPNNPERRP